MMRSRTSVSPSSVSHFMTSGKRFIPASKCGSVMRPCVGAIRCVRTRGGDGVRAGGPGQHDPRPYDIERGSAGGRRPGTGMGDPRLRLLPDIRRRGVVLDANGIVDAASGIASPCFDDRGRIFCSISLAGPTGRIIAQQAEFERLVFNAGEEISRILGYQGPYPATEIQA